MTSPGESPLPPEPQREPILGCVLGGFVVSGLGLYPVILLSCDWPDSLTLAVGLHLGFLLLHRFAIWAQNVIEGTLLVAIPLLLILLGVPAAQKVRKAVERQRQEQQQGPPDKGSAR